MCEQPGTPDTLIAVTSGNTMQQLSHCRGQHYGMHDLLHHCMKQKESETFVRAKISHLKKNPSQSRIKTDVHYLNRLSHLKWYFKKARGCSKANQYQQ